MVSFHMSGVRYIAVCLSDGLEGGLGEVAKGGGTTASAEVELGKVGQSITYEV